MHELTIRYNTDQELQLLILLLDKLHFVYEPPVLAKKAPSKKAPKKAVQKVEAPTLQPPVFRNIADKYAGKLSSETAKALQQHIIESRNEWERNI